MTTAGYLVEGMTCRYCMAKVLENVRSLSGVSDVAMDLVMGGRSPLIVMSRTRLGVEAVREAVENAGFDLLSPGVARFGDTAMVFPPEAGGTPTGRQSMKSSIGGVRS